MRARRQVRDADTDVTEHERVRPREVLPEHSRVEPRHRGDERVDVGGEQRDRLRAVAALELVQDVLVLGQRTESVDGVGRQDHGAACAQRGDRVLGHRRNEVSAARNASGCST